MGTFHQDRDELHGITVVVDTRGNKVFIGRCDQRTENEILLVGATMHEAQTSGKSKQEFVQQAAKFGFWEQIPRVAVPLEEVVSIQKLGEIVYD